MVICWTIPSSLCRVAMSPGNDISTTTCRHCSWAEAATKGRSSRPVSQNTPMANLYVTLLDKLGPIWIASEIAPGASHSLLARRDERMEMNSKAFCRMFGLLSAVQLWRPGGDLRLVDACQEKGRATRCIPC